ncbi:hypothetical protein DdX_12979 [Ditylenchus destructor]|uniref:Uncharacterized protein n=1 Tax=Ditylenchus destructor TaxID=166010 RepID=A0AAD4MZJ2_9BILA|nr:hypothetical protein DdX_12979 [Ditylenchus destructor]
MAKFWGGLISLPLILLFATVTNAYVVARGYRPGYGGGFVAAGGGRRYYGYNSYGYYPSYGYSSYYYPYNYGYYYG